MTKEELKLQTKITKLEETNKKLEDKLKSKEKSSFNLKYLTTTKFGFHFSQIISVIILIFCMYMCKYLINDTIQLAVVLSALIGCAVYVVKKYCDIYSIKSLADSENQNKNERYKMKLKSASETCEKYSKGEITEKGVYLYKNISEENTTTIQSNGFGGSTVIDSTNYLAQNPTSEIENPLDNNVIDNSTPQG